MSTVFYGYRIKKRDFWSFLDKVRTEYKRDSLSLLRVQVLYKAIISETIKYHEALTDLKKNEEVTVVRLQLFDRGNYFYFRVLECGYYFMNRHEEWSEVEPVFYDSRTDIPPEHKKNRKIVDWIDNEIRQRHYFIAHIVDYEDMSRWLWDMWEKQKEVMPSA